MDDIANMNLKTFETFYNNIEMLQAQELLVSFQAGDYPHLKNDSRDKLYRQIRKTAYPFEKQKVLTGEEIERFLNG